MPRIIKSIVLLLVGLTLCGGKCPAQTVTLKKTWVGPHLEYLQFTDTTVVVNNRAMDENFYYHLTGNELVLTENYWVNEDTTRYEERTKFTIVRLTADSLILATHGYMLRRLFPGSDTLWFTDVTNTNNPDLKFQKLYFSGDGCLGRCRIMEVEIDSTGKMIFSGQRYTGVYKGLFRGHLTHKNLNKLVSILQHSSIDNMPEEMGTPLDAPYYKFVFYYNGKRRECHGYYLPRVCYPLLHFMLNSYKHAVLIRSFKKYQFEKCREPVDGI